ncbi:MAG: alanine--tRNA ligase [Gammaproteobacteria bacterium]|nr:alanine--tRNA ligase [Gammaproteobacteria bacterium]
MTTSELRQLFLSFFEARDHRIVPSSPLVPGNDPTLLFTNAGMVQFKDVFLGAEQRAYTRAASSQRCVRAGGKHNDLENVGYTARHHTFFEMLGNFSFGDYFKHAAIQYAWEFITQELQIPAERLWVTVYEDDDEAAGIWLNEIGVDPQRFGRMGEKDNFWSMGDTGPCGPCSEIFYDHGDSVAGGPPGSADEEGDRYVEIWNLVFMQFDRDAAGKMTPLPKPSVDTGMGLERIAAVMQGVHSNYEIDLFVNLIRAAAELTGPKDLQSSSLRVIADHIRACAFLIVDGVLPGNEGRGYVLRRIIRRALRHGYELGVQEPFFHQLAGPLAEEMGDAYPELSRSIEHVEKVLLKEEERFAATLSNGMHILQEALENVAGKQLPGDLVFKLYDTYGFPVDLTADVARARGIEVDLAGFESAMQEQKTRGRDDRKTKSGRDAGLQLDFTTDFTGYEHLEDTGRILAIIQDGELVEETRAGESAALVLDRTPFYAESGGQVGDHGVIRSAAGFVFRVSDTQKSGSAYLHIGTSEAGAVRTGDEVQAEVDGAARGATVLNHSATHLLHAALRSVLGSHVSQKGSLVAPDRLRFDFSHYEALTDEQLHRIEQLVNQQIRQNAPADTAVMSYDDALGSGAVALFDEKYGDRVRVLRIGDFSVELCGGTHVQRAGDIGLCKIIAESGIAAGVRRIEAVTGEKALQHLADAEQTLDRISSLLKGGRNELEAKIQQVLERNKTLEKENQKLTTRLADTSGSDLAAGAVEIAGIKVLAVRLDDGVGPHVLRDAVDRMKDKLGTAAVVLGSATADGKVRLAAGVTKDVMDQIKAGDLVNSVATQVGGKGGGRPDFAQAGGSNADGLSEALAAVPDWLARHLGS